MTRYVEFWHKGVMTDKLIPACGSDSIYYLDARQSDYNQHAQAAKIAKQRGFSGYRIMAYPIRNDRPLTNLITL